MDVHKPIAEFDPDFATPAEWAAVYRGCGLQVVPAWSPHEVSKNASWKRPKLNNWTKYCSALITDEQFDVWYSPTGQFARHGNMGIITGTASGNLFVVDLDIHKKQEALSWWVGLLSVHNNDLDLETAEQQTGGGGLQKLFRAPPDWHCPTGKTPLGVDIRGQGGFAVLAPSLHDTEKLYSWLPGRAPWDDVGIAMAPEWLLEAIEELIAAHGGINAHSGEVRIDAGERIASPGGDYNAFGGRQDGREEYMRDLIWAAMLGFRRACPIPPGSVERAAVWADYERNTRSRLQQVEGVSNAELLEREGRGASLFANKWRRALKKWDGTVKLEAARPKPGIAGQNPDWVSDANQDTNRNTNRNTLFEYLSIDQIKKMADPAWLVSGLVVEEALGFIYGPPGCLKTFIALDMALSFTVGMPDWWGRTIERKGAVVYISGEGQADLKFRIQAWEQHNKVLTDDSPFFLIRQTINFMKAEDVGKLLATVQVIADLARVPITAVFVDTVSRVLPGSDENLQKDMTLFVAACDAVRQRFGATVIGLHHTSRAGNIRGSTVIPGAGDFLVEVRREPGAPNGSIFATKIKSAEDGWEQNFRIEKIQLGDIGGNSSLVVMPVDVAPKREGGQQWPDKDTCRQILAAIDEQWATGKPWCFAKNTSRAGVTNIMKRWRLKRDVAGDILDTWNANGVIAEELRDVKNHITGYRKMVDI